MVVHHGNPMRHQNGNLGPFSKAWISLIEWIHPLSDIIVCPTPLHLWVEIWIIEDLNVCRNYTPGVCNHSLPSLECRDVSLLFLITACLSSHQVYIVRTRQLMYNLRVAVLDCIPCKPCGNLFHQHDAEWIEAGLPGEGNIIIFNNGLGRLGGNYSSIDEIVPPIDPDGSYTLNPGSAYGPDEPLWTYTAEPPTAFYAENLSGAQRLPNGNTLICNGPNSYFFEITASGEKVWEYDYTNMVFRVERYAYEYSGFDGTPLDDPAYKVFLPLLLKLQH